MDTEVLATEIASRLRAERGRANLTLREAGDKSGVHYVSISRYEQGKMPTVDCLYRLAEAYGVEVASLLPPPGTIKVSPLPDAAPPKKKAAKK